LILPVDGFFEWKAIKGQKAKQPYAIAMEDGVPLDRGHLGGKEPVSSEWRRLNLRSSPISRSFSTSFKRSQSQPDQLSEKFLRKLRKICPVESRKIAKKIVKISVS